VEVRSSARRHGVKDDDMLRAFRNALRVIELEYNGGIQLLVIGPARRTARTGSRERLAAAHHSRDAATTELLRVPEVMEMPRQDPKADELERWLNAIEPNPADARDATHMRRIIAAAAALQDAEEELRSAVAAARDAGDTWDMIGVALGVTRQAVFQRFGQKEPNARKRSSRKVAARKVVRKSVRLGR
jgi:hypothetical protein